MMPSTVVADPNWIVKMRITVTTSWPNCTGVIDMDGEPIGTIEFVSQEAADAYLAFNARLCRIKTAGTP